MLISQRLVSIAASFILFAPLAIKTDDDDDDDDGCKIGSR